jgi:hypothetical protein
MPVWCHTGVSLHDPVLTGPRRAILASALYLASLAAAAVAGWGWARVTGPASGGAAPTVAVMTGQFGALGMFLATSFALPVRWRGGATAGALMTAQAGTMLIAVGAGAAVALSALGEPLVAPVALGALGVALVPAAVLIHIRSRRRAAARNEMIRTGQRAQGVVTEAVQTGSINNVPRWRVVVRFTDGSGASRLVTQRTTTWHPPSVDQRAVVHFDPSRPGDQRHMVVTW